MAQRVFGYTRQPDDEYETPPWVTQMIIPHLNGCQFLWDPANGPRSAIARELRAHKFDAIVTNDNFLARTTTPHKRVDAVCTNPPYGVQGKLACQFITHALALVPVVAMLLRSSISILARRAFICFGIAKPSHAKLFYWTELSGLNTKGRRQSPMPGNSWARRSWSPRATANQKTGRQLDHERRPLQSDRRR